MGEMKADWDRRAIDNALSFSATSKTEEEYDRVSRRKVQNLLSDLKMIRGEWTVLEIGCGVGGLLTILIPLFAKVYGVDTSPNMIEKAKKRIKNLPNVQLYENNGRDLSVFSDDSFDLLLSHSVFQHCPRDVFYGYVGECFRVLKPNGVFAFQMCETRGGLHSLLKGLVLKLRQLIAERRLSALVAAGASSWIWREPPPVRYLESKVIQKVRFEGNSGSRGIPQYPVQGCLSRRP